MNVTGLATAANISVGGATAISGTVTTLNVGSLSINGISVIGGSAFGTASIGTASMGSVSIGTATIGSALITTETINISSIGTASITSGTVFNFSSTATSGTTTIVGGTHQALSSSGTSNIYPGSGTFNLSSGTTIITGGTVSAPNYTSSLTEYQVVQSYAPTAFWQLNEASGNFIDYSGNGYTGTAFNLGYGSPGPGVNSIGSAAYFNGVNSQATANPSGLTNKNTTIVAWFKPGGGNGSAGPVIAVGSNYKIADGDGFSFGIGNTSYTTTGTNFIGLFANKRYINTGVGISTANWHMGAMVLDGSGYPSLYLDGRLIYSDSAGTAFNPSGGSVTIGHDNTNNTLPNYFNGYIADAAIFNTALNATQIADLYQTTSIVYGGSANFSSVTANTITGTGACPPGMVSPYAGSVAPNGWLLCQGQTVSRSTYPNLFAAIGTLYGAGDGVTTFLLPNMTGRVPVGLDASSTVITSGNANVLGESHGEETHTLTTTEMPTHTHTGTTDSGKASITSNINDAGVTNNQVYNNAVYGSGSTSGFLYSLSGADHQSLSWALLSSAVTSTDSGHTHTFTTANTGGSAAHNNMQPYITLNYIIKT